MSFAASYQRCSGSAVLAFVRAVEWVLETSSITAPAMAVRRLYFIDECGMAGANDS